MKQFFALLVCCVGLVVFFPISKVHAVGNLQNLQDIINSTNNQASNVEHQVSFTLPPNALQISTTDFIIVDLSNFSDVAENVSLTGIYGGTPTSSVNGTDVKITGITLLPGYRLQIDGITATNPSSSMGYEITVIIAEDEAGTIIKNIGSTIASAFPGNVSISATVEPPVASLVINGYTAPSTFVTFTENGSVIGTDTAGPTGYFEQHFTGLNPDTHSLRIYGVDQSGRATAPIFIEIYTPIYQETTVGNIILPPTISIVDSTVTAGDDVVVLGTTVPSADLSVFSDSPLRSYISAADSSGNWNYTITDTIDYIPGDYRVYTIAQSGPLQSLSSTALGFTILSSSGVTPTPAGCDISEGDLNCDGSVNLTDFSMLMFHWGTNQVSADMNSDGMVNLTDFSIMMYYWGT